MDLVTNKLLVPFTKFRPAKRIKQHGFTLIALLILSSMASVVVLNSLKDNAVQERLSGNFQKQLFARLMAEKGAFKTYDTLVNNLEENPDATLLQLTEDIVLTDNAENMKDTGYTVPTPTVTTKGINIAVIGKRNEGEKTLNVAFARSGSKTSQSSLFSNGVVGCDGVSVQGGATVNSYNSSENAWDGGAGATNNAMVRTINDDGNVKLIGNATITGHVLSTNSIEIGGSSTITGDVQTNGYLEGPRQSNAIFGGNVTAFKYVNLKDGSVAGNIYANGYVAIDSTTVTGDIFSGDYITANTNPIGGSLLAKGDITLDHSNVGGNIQTYGSLSVNELTIGGLVRADGDLEFINGPTISSDDLIYVGTYTNNNSDSKYGNPPYKRWSEYFNFNPLDSIYVVPLLPGDFDVPASDPSYLPCDSLGDIGSDGKPKGILPEVDQVKAAYTTEHAIVGGQTLNLYASGNTYTLSSTKGSFSDGSRELFPTGAEFLNTYEQVFMFDNIVLQNGVLQIEENTDVVIYVAGDFEMKGNQESKLKVPGTSSLTLIISGQLSIGASTRMKTASAGISPSGKPVFTIYSGYQSSGNEDYGVDISGSTEGAYAAIYAPYADVKITSSVVFKGAIVGKSVSVEGSGLVVFDEALGDVTAGTVEEINQQFKISIAGWEYE